MAHKYCLYFYRLLCIFQYYVQSISLWISYWIWSLYLCHFLSVFLHSLFRSLIVGYCFHGAFCLLMIVLTFTGAMSLIIFTVFELKLFSLTVDLSFLEVSVQRELKKRVINDHTPVWSCTIFTVIDLSECGNIDTSKNTEMIGQGQVLDGCGDIEALCDDKVQGMTKRVSWPLYMLC